MTKSKHAKLSNELSQVPRQVWYKLSWGKMLLFISYNCSWLYWIAAKSHTPPKGTPILFYFKNNCFLWGGCVENCLYQRMPEKFASNWKDKRKFENCIFPKDYICNVKINNFSFLKAVLGFKWWPYCCNDMIVDLFWGWL